MEEIAVSKCTKLIKKRPSHTSSRLALLPKVHLLYWPGGGEYLWKQVDDIYIYAALVCFLFIRPPLFNYLYLSFWRIIRLQLFHRMTVQFLVDMQSCAFRCRSWIRGCGGCRALLCTDVTKERCLLPGAQQETSVLCVSVFGGVCLRAIWGDPIHWKHHSTRLHCVQVCYCSSHV